MRESLQVNGHSIGIYASIWNGKEAISYDGTVVSEYRNLLILSSIHSFKVQEDGTEAIYEVQLLSGIGRIGFAVRRNGIIQGHKP